MVIVLPFANDLLVTTSFGILIKILGSSSLTAPIFLSKANFFILLIRLPIYREVLMIYSVLSALITNAADRAASVFSPSATMHKIIIVVELIHHRFIIVFLRSSPETGILIE